MRESSVLMLCVIVVMSVLSVSLKVSYVLCSVVLSAYMRNWNLLVTFGKSFMKSRKSRGPSMEPWGTPRDVVKVLDEVPS